MSFSTYVRWDFKSRDFKNLKKRGILKMKYNLFFISKHSLRDYVLKHRGKKILAKSIQEKNNIINFCRSHKLSYDMLPLQKCNYARIALLTNEVKSII